MTTVIIFCKDKTKRVIKLQNNKNIRWSLNDVVKLGKDIEGSNYLDSIILS